MSPSETAMIVIVNPVANSPASDGPEDPPAGSGRSRGRGDRCACAAASATRRRGPPRRRGTRRRAGTRSRGPSARSGQFPPRRADGPSVLVWVVGVVEPRVRGRTGHAVFEHPDCLEVRSVLACVGLGEQPRRRAWPSESGPRSAAADPPAGQGRVGEAPGHIGGQVAAVSGPVVAPCGNRFNVAPIGSSELVAELDAELVAVGRVRRTATHVKRRVTSALWLVRTMTWS